MQGTPLRHISCCVPCFWPRVPNATQKSYLPKPPGPPTVSSCFFIVGKWLRLWGNGVSFPGTGLPLCLPQEVCHTAWEDGN